MGGRCPISLRSSTPAAGERRNRISNCRLRRNLCLRSENLRLAGASLRGSDRQNAVPLPSAGPHGFRFHDAVRLRVRRKRGEMEIAVIRRCRDIFPAALVLLFFVCPHSLRAGLGGTHGRGLGASASSSATGVEDGFGGRSGRTGGITIPGTSVGFTTVPGTRIGIRATENGSATT
jgi:hypothetical protein